jgi:poly(3-hydroxybutyrate) depolymerase
MLYRPSFRQTTFALTAGAILAATAAFPAAAQQASQINFKGTPDCATVTDGGKRAACEFFRKVDDANKRGAAADKRSAAADDEGKCLSLIVTDLEHNGTKTANLQAMPPKGQACKAARDLKLISG